MCVYMMYLLQVNHHAAAARVPGILNTCWSPFANMTEYNVGTRNVSDTYIVIVMH